MVRYISPGKIFAWMVVSLAQFSEVFMNSYDVIMMGGGLMGCATAYYLLKLDPTIKVAIIEKDHSYERSSTVLSDGNLRIQFNIKENILISQYGLEMLKRFPEEMA